MRKSLVASKAEVENRIQIRPDTHGHTRAPSLARRIILTTLRECCTDKLSVGDELTTDNEAAH